MRQNARVLPAGVFVFLCSVLGKLSHKRQIVFRGNDDLRILIHKKIHSELLFEAFQQGHDLSVHQHTAADPDQTVFIDAGNYVAYPVEKIFGQNMYYLKPRNGTGFVPKKVIVEVFHKLSKWRVIRVIYE